MTRFAAMQTCPALRSPDAMSPVAAASRFASSNTMNGALPPSSMLTRLSVAAERSMRYLPTFVEPVNPILRTVLLDRSASPIAEASPDTTLRTPAVAAGADRMLVGHTACYSCGIVGGIQTQVMRGACCKVRSEH